MNEIKESWIILFVASLLEVEWTIILGKISGFFSLLITLICIVISFWGLIVDSKKIITGIAYALFVGMGCIGTSLVSVVF